MRSLFPLLALGLAACTADPYSLEGTEPFECRDGADNDGDGYFDCQDNGCWNSPDCGGVPVDTGDPGDTGNPGDTSDDSGDTSETGDTSADTDGDTSTPQDCTAPHCDYTAVTVSYTITWTPWELGSVLYGDPCTTTWTGEGTVSEATNTRLSFSGDWKLDSDDCPETYGGAPEAAVWYDRPTSEADTDYFRAYHSFFFSSGSTVLDDWFAHSNSRGYTTTAQTNYYVTEMYLDMDPEHAAPSAQWLFEEVLADAYLELAHDLTVTFTK